MWYYIRKSILPEDMHLSLFDKNKQSEDKHKAAVEKVDRMNRIFDKYVIPLLIFCVVAAILSSLVMDSSCSGCVPSGYSGNSLADIYESVSGTEVVSQT